MSKSTSQFCQHCGLPIPQDAPPGSQFCCPGCQAAYQLLNGLGLDSYYDKRVNDPTVRPLKPDDVSVDLSSEVRDGSQPGTSQLTVVVDGLHCAACVWLVETLLQRHPAVTVARLNMTTRRLRLEWQGDARPRAECGLSLAAISGRMPEICVRSTGKGVITCNGGGGVCCGQHHVAVGVGLGRK
jgi:Cu2+-exporting ATPase